MGNCFKTQLKVRVDNPNLYKMGELRVAISGSMTSLIVRSKSTEGIDVEVFSGDITLNGSNKIHVNNINNNITVAGTSGIISISNKYDLNIIGSYSEGEKVSINLSDIKYASPSRVLCTLNGDTSISPVWDSIYMIQTFGGTLSGNISDFFANIPNGTLKLNYMQYLPNLTGNIEDFAVKMDDTSTTDVCTIDTHGSNIRGSIQAYVNAKRAIAQNSGLVYMNNMNNYITVDAAGEIALTAAHTEFSWTANTITVKDGSVETTYEL